MTKRDSFDFTNGTSKCVIVPPKRPAEAVKRPYDDGKRPNISSPPQKKAKPDKDDKRYASTFENDSSPSKELGPTQSSDSEPSAPLRHTNASSDFIHKRRASTTASGTSGNTSVDEDFDHGNGDYYEEYELKIKSE